MITFKRSFTCRWSDADANGHIRHTVYPELGAEVRLAWLASAGVGWRELGQAGIGPVVLREEIDYLRELGLGVKVEVDLQAVGLSPDGGRWRLRHTFRRDGGEEVARVVAYGGWLDLARRKLTLPPEPLLALMRDTERAPDFQELPPLRRKDGAGD